MMQHSMGPDRMATGPNRDEAVGRPAQNACQLSGRPRHTGPARGGAGATALALAAVALLAGPALAQEIVGSVTHVTTSAPLPGVLVSVIDPGGIRVRVVLSDEVGRYRVEVPLGRYELRASRIGLQSVTAGPFDVRTLVEHRHDLEMMERPIAIAGLVVDGRIASCRIDEDQAVRIQRWWSEIRTALDVSAAMQEEVFADFRVERFEREWDVDLTDVRHTSTTVELSQSSQPFMALDADALAERGYVQGNDDGGRDYYAPDADVLLSGSFLSGHCFRLVQNEAFTREIGLEFEPTEDRQVPDVRGTLWVDTTTAELQRLEFRYVNVPDLDADEAGGRIDFEVLPSGAWIVSDWYIRMPRWELRRVRRLNVLVLVGYTDVGASASALRPSGALVTSGSVGAVRGVLVDSLRGGGLADATVSVLGTRFQARTDEEGRFVLLNVPVGRHNLSFHHEETSAWGVGSPLVGVEVFEGRTTETRLALPAFRSLALGLCRGSGSVAPTILIAHVLGSDQGPLADTSMEFAWYQPEDPEMPLSAPVRSRTDGGGRVVVCRVPAGARVVAHAERDGGLVEVFELVTQPEAVSYRRVWLRW